LYNGPPLFHKPIHRRSRTPPWDAGRGDQLNAATGYNPESSLMRLARLYLVSGRVQGVGFRQFVHRAAAIEGLHGWVRNLPDGRVEIQAEGEREALRRFEHKVRQGPPASRVDELETTDVGATGHDTGFTIR
jgi:acylphosphatase